jgi:hypothetical protein
MEHMKKFMLIIQEGLFSALYLVQPAVENIGKRIINVL